MKVVAPRGRLQFEGAVYLGGGGRIGAESAKRKNNPDRRGELVVRVKSRKVRIRKKKRKEKKD